MRGVINLIKPPHMTSHDMVAIVRRHLSMKRVGHTGTLDPMAVGVLPICLGHATKIVDYLVDDRKVYRCKMVLGAKTTTQDAWGETTDTSDKVVSAEEIEKVMQTFVGDIMQVPPMYSALKVKGKKLVDLARQGIEVEREARPRTIYRLSIISIDANEVWFDCECQKGTYIRTLCHDIGEALGCFAHMGFLLRTRTGNFTIEKGLSVEEFLAIKPEDVHEILWSEVDALTLSPLHLPTSIEKEIYLGKQIDFTEYVETESDQYAVLLGDTFCGVAHTREDGVFFKKRMF